MNFIIFYPIFIVCLSHKTQTNRQLKLSALHVLFWLLIPLFCPIKLIFCKLFIYRMYIDLFIIYEFVTLVAKYFIIHDQTKYIIITKENIQTLYAKCLKSKHILRLTLCDRLAALK